MKDESFRKRETSLLWIEKKLGYSVHFFILEWTLRVEKFIERRVIRGKKREGLTEKELKRRKER